MKPPSHLPALLGEAIVASALEILNAEENGFTSTVPKDRALLESAAVRDAIARVPGVYDAGRWKQVVTRLAIALARDVVKLWSNSYPDRTAPLRAVEAAEAWVVCPCQGHADAAADKMSEAAHEAMTAWRDPPKEAAWAGRTAAWAADAPKYGWQTVAAIRGACRATSSVHVIELAERFFTAELSQGELGCD